MADGDRRRLPDRTGGKLGRHLFHDPGNRDYPTRGVLFAEGAPLVTRDWRNSIVYDQGQESSCTAQAAVGVLMSRPFRRALPKDNYSAYNSSQERSELYVESKKHDPWENENYEGTSTDAPFRVLRERGQIVEWRWNFGVDDVLRCLSGVGACAIGITWKRDMMETDDRGFIHFSGSKEGGHAVKLDYILVTKKLIVVEGPNSWSRDNWPANWKPRPGRFRMTAETLDSALRDEGESVTIVLPAA